MKKLVLGMALALSIILAASASAATVPVTSLSGDFAATNPSVTLTPDGVAYGPYANGGSAGGSLYYAGANGLTLAQLTELNYKFRYNTTNDTPLGAPYLRIFLNGDANDVIFDPTECAAASPPENTDVTVEITAGDVRYDNDGCDPLPAGQQTPWSDVVAAHGATWCPASTSRRASRAAWMPPRCCRS
jgi:hypothetical protein